MAKDDIKKDNCLDNYDYIAYVDASGDDGYKFNTSGNGSSRCYAVAMFVVKKEDVQFNENKLLAIKRIVGCKPKHEVKYTKLRRHRRSKDIHNLVSEMRGTIVSWIAFKEKITDPLFLDIKNKALTQFCHTFPINAVSDVLKYNTDTNIFIAVDVMKKIEMDGVKELVQYSFNSNIIDSNEKSITNYTLKFKDSKDKNFQLIQAADIFAGIIRSSFENWPFEHEVWKTCQLCRGLIKLGKLKNLCK